MDVKATIRPPFQLYIVQRRADRRTTRQRTEILADLTIDTDGDRLFTDLERERCYWLVQQIEQRSYLADALLRGSRKFVVHNGAP
jgi:hypothetical protein